MYRIYYALGGTGFLFGTIAEPSVFRRVNAVGAAVIFVLALFPLAALRFWDSKEWRRWVLVACWLVAIGACAHALIDITQRVLSLSGHLQVHHSATVWRSIDYRKSDLQDLFFNEPWFLIEGLLFAILGLKNVSTRARRRAWLLTIGAAVAVAYIVGMLSATGVIGRLIIG